MTLPTIPNCPKCGKDMILRTKKGTSFQFYGCSAFPKCNGYKPFSAPKVDRSNVSMATNVIGSSEQDAVWNAMLNDTQHLVIEAVAGGGKTFTIVHGAMLMREKLPAHKTLFIAFNNHIVKELETKLPQDIMVKTMHSFSYKQVRNFFPKVSLDENKLDGIIDEYVPEDDNTDYIKSSIKRIVELCKYNMLDGRNESELDDLVYMHGIDLNDHRSQIYTIVPQVIKTSKARKNVIDFTDMLWFVYAHNIPVEQFDVVIADELQDFNPLQQYVAMRAIGNKGRFVGVGDRFQSIYGFAGADINSIPNMIAKLSETDRSVKQLPLNETRRCPVSITHMAQAIVPHIRPLDTAKIGTIDSMTENKAIERITIGNMGICRRNAPLIKVAYALIRNNTPVMIKGRDFGKGLLALVRKFKAQSINEMIEKAEQYRAKELDKLQKKGSKAANSIQSLNDRIDTLVAMTDGLSDLSELRDRINKLFNDLDNKNAVTLSSVHRAKGLESEVVFIFDYGKIELPMVLPHQQQQEKNLHYVAVTRSRDTLILVD